MWLYFFVDFSPQKNLTNKKLSVILYIDITSIDIQYNFFGDYYHVSKRANVNYAL
jgi:hypothetical protein